MHYLLEPDPGELRGTNYDFNEPTILRTRLPLHSVAISVKLNVRFPVVTGRERVKGYLPRVPGIDLKRHTISEDPGSISGCIRQRFVN